MGLPRVGSAIGAGTIALWLGAGVESGAPPDQTVLAVRDALLRWCDTAKDGAVPEVEQAITSCAQSLVAHLTRDDQAKDQLAQDDILVAGLESADTTSLGPAWVLRVLSQRSGTLVVIHAEARAGVNVEFSNVESNFELFSLLQDELAGRFPGAARGSGPRALSVGTAWWHYGRGDVPRADIGGTVWGEGSPDDIPMVDGHRVLLLWSPILAGRSWHGFEGPEIASAPAEVCITSRLTDNELDRWWAILDLPPATRPSGVWGRLRRGRSLR
ncbi:MAG: hypothetical protein GY708_07450 [Actinomycetia bacterium]|nr:hypothetical protein [Actinomycetes bacterium]MCP4960529.1 hypothetical protein [Actinomycetes bacterium]